MHVVMAQQDPETRVAEAAHIHGYGMVMDLRRPPEPSNALVRRLVNVDRPRDNDERV
ncbi:MAG: hypothetical protein M3N32_06265 [Actinomycetota bacterium]|nr:hypothetical protein [Actinomycetota bacterium]